MAKNVTLTDEKTREDIYPRTSASNVITVDNDSVENVLKDKADNSSLESLRNETNNKIDNNTQSISDLSDLYNDFKSKVDNEIVNLFNNKANKTDVVTIAGSQNVTGVKNFTNGISINKADIVYDNTINAIKITFND